MENKPEEKPTSQDQVSNEQPKQTVPAPIPEKSAWKLEVTETVTEISGGK